MRVLFVIDYGTPTGGAEIQTLRFRELLRERGHEVEIFSSDARPGGADVLSDVTCFGSQGPARKILQAVNPMAQLALRRVIRSYRPDVVHVRMFLSQLSPLILHELSSVPTLLHVVNYQLICPLNTKLLPSGESCNHRAGGACQDEGCISPAGRARFELQRKMWNWWHHAVDVTISNSKWTAARLRNDGIAVDSNFTYGVPTTAETAQPGPTPRAAFVGRLFRKKGVDVLLQAMALLVKRLPTARLDVIGDGPERGRLEALVNDLGLSGNCQMHGFVRRERIAELLHDSWVQAVPSTYEEPFGVVTIEAMMRGSAVVASNSGGPAEVVRDGETGLLVRPGDPELLADALFRILSDRQLASRMGKAAREVALRDFTEASSIDRVLGWYETTVERFRSKHQ